jgi:hypothetical protein
MIERTNANNGWKSSFKTKVDRNAYLEMSNNPGPGYYDVKLVRHAKSVIKERVEKVGRNLSDEVLGAMDLVRL